MSQFSVQFLACATILLACLFTLQVADVGPNFEHGNPIEVEQVDPMTTFRQTNEGWQDSANWRISREESRIRAIDYFHPLVWTLLVVIAVLIAMVLSTGEEELAHMLGDTDSNQFEAATGNSEINLSTDVVEIVRTAAQSREP